MPLSKKKLNSFSAFSDLADDRTDPFLINRAEGGDGKAEGDKSVFLWDPEPFCL